MLICSILRISSIIIIIIIIIVTWSDSCFAAILLLAAAIYSQPYTAFNFAIDKDQKALFPTAKGRFRLFISATYHPYVFVSVSFGYWHLSVCQLYVVVYYPYVSVCYPYVVHVFPSYWYSYVPACIRVLLVYYPYVTLVYLCGVFSQDPGKRLQTEVKKITHIILLSFTQSIYFSL